MGSTVKYVRRLFVQRSWIFVLALALGALCFNTKPALAYDWQITAHVTSVQPTYLPGQAAFLVDTAGGSCAAGAWLTWPAQGADEAAQIANTQAVYSSLLSAMLTGKSVVLFGNNSGCTISFIWILR